MSRVSPVADGPGQQGTAPLTSNLKLLRLLEAIAETSQPFGVSELARRVGGSRSMVHRQIVTLVAAGWLTNTESGQYTLTFAPVRLGQAALQHSSVDERISKELRQLADRLGEGASLGTLEGDHVLVVGRGLPTRNVQVSLAHGSRFPIDGSALGHVLASYCEEERAADFERRNVTIPDAGARAEIRTRGYETWVDNEFDPIEVLAVPVGRTQGDVRFALSAHWPQGRSRAQSVLPMLEESARVIEDLTRRSTGMETR